MSVSWEGNRAALLKLMGAATPENPVHIYPPYDAVGHTGDDDCPCGPILKRIEWPELTCWAKVHPALTPEDAYQPPDPEEDP